MSGPPGVLVVDDDPDLRALVVTLLKRNDMEAIEAADGDEAVRQFYANRPDLVVLDVSMPNRDGWAVLERIREMSSVPVLMLTSSVGELDKVRGLRGGADDYVAKPFGTQELIARIQALLRRAEPRADPPPVHTDSAVMIDFGQRRVVAGGSELSLTPTEFKMLSTFVQHPGQVLSHDQLLELVWGDLGASSRESVKLYVGYLRRKLREASVDPIRTVRGFGYRYEPGSPGRPGTASHTDE